MIYSVSLAFPADFEAWRSAARRLLAPNIAPADVSWGVQDGEGGLFETAAPLPPLPAGAQTLTISARFLALAKQLICHADPARFDLAYRLLCRIKAEPYLLSVRSDPDVHRAHQFERAVARDMHKMKAFVRFREARDEDGPIFLSWFEPSHHILDAVAPFFVRRFANERWVILTPGRSACWDGESLRIQPSDATRRNIPDADALEDYWRTYFASIFNPARLKVDAMQSEMPKKYWQNLPEAPLIAPLIAKARREAAAMIDKAPTNPAKRAAKRKALFEPEDAAADAPTLEKLRIEAKTCKACPLWEPATQTIFGEGPSDARLMLVGEQPGDQEDLAGKPFVGPAGAVLDKALAEAGIDRSQVYVTNAVKHFKFEPRGKRRLHQKPNSGEIKACRFWLQKERLAVQPRLIVGLGATAAQSILSRPVKLMSERGRPVEGEMGETIFLTVHPSYLLRLPDAASKAAQYSAFVQDLRKAAASLSGEPD
jgi:DNA polymerase